VEPKYAARKLVLGKSALAAAGLKKYIGLDDDAVFGNMMLDREAAIELEFLLHGSKEDVDNFNYVFQGTAEKNLPPHVEDDVRRGEYHGGALQPGDYDKGHAGMTLNHFVTHETSHIAGLKRCHVLVLRLYTSNSFGRFNRPLRGGDNPHPFRMSVYVLAEAIKMLRVVNAKLHSEKFNQVEVEILTSHLATQFAIEFICVELTFENVCSGCIGA